jgi:hypothetical protein
MAPAQPSIVFRTEDQSQRNEAVPSKNGYIVDINGVFRKALVDETIVELNKSSIVELNKSSIVELNKSSIVELNKSSIVAGFDTGSERTHSSDEEVSSQADDGGKCEGSESSVLSDEDGAQARKRFSLDFWTKRMADSPRCLFPMLAENSSDSGAFESQPVDVDPSQLHQFCETQGVDFLTVLQVVWVILLQGYTITDEVCFGFSTVGRQKRLHANVSRARPTFDRGQNQQHFGFCHIATDEYDTFASLAQRLQQDLEQSLEYQDLDCTEIDNLLSPSQKIFNTAVALHQEEDVEAYNDPSPTRRNHVSIDIPQVRRIAFPRLRRF